MVSWFSPRELASTGLYLVVASAFGSYADRRELQAALTDPAVADYSTEGEVWIDYTADTGDGWDSTYAVAKLLAKENLPIDHDGRRHDTERGRILVLGGDEVYPHPGRDNYNDRLMGPFRAALPCTREKHPHLFAVPGNHDWYDGLSSFLKIFCQKGWIGGWQTEQTRSYFACRLPRGWWLWGLDIQLSDLIDEPQLEYFKRIGKDEVKEGDSIILCTAKPEWARMSGDVRHQAKDLAVNNLKYFERKIVPEGARIALTLAGDLHHYARYESEAGHHKITVGGGGAYLYPTHGLRKEIEWPEKGEPLRYERRGLFPSVGESKRRRWGALLMPLRNPSFCVVPAAVYLALAWIVHAAGRSGGISLADAMRDATFKDLGSAMFTNTSSALAVLVVLVLLMMAADGRSGMRTALGVVHTAIHLAVLLGVMTGSARLLSRWGVEDPWFGAAFLVSVAVLGGLAGALGTGIYFLLAQIVFRSHPNEAFACQRIAGYKCFLRMHIDTGGVLHLYPIGVRKVPRGWKLVEEGREEDPWFAPKQATLDPELIEEPISIPPLPSGG